MASHKINIQRCFAKASETYDKYSLPQQIIGNNLIAILLKYMQEAFNIIDLGCGTGIVTEQLAHRIPFENFHAMDLVDKFLIKARERLCNTPINIYQQDFEEIPHTEILFDLVFSNMSLQWALDFEKVLQIIFKMTKATSLIAFSIPIEGTFHELNTSSRNNFYTIEKLNTLLNTVGFKIKELSDETLVFNYQTWVSALKSIKHTGANYLFKPSKNNSSILKAKPTQLTYHVAYVIASRA